MSTQQLAVVSRTTEIIGEKDIGVLRQSLFKDFTDAQVAECVQICNLLQLNPILRQIHFVKRNTKQGPVISVQTGIDGFRLQAQRAGGYAGSDDPVFEYRPNDPVKKIPVKATVTVYRIVSGMRCAFTGSARWEEYNAGQGLWNTMPHNQLAKCAEALALRKAFPAELSILRSDEEMDQADRPDKAGAIKEKIQTEAPAPAATAPIEVEGREVKEESESSCPHCQSMNVMLSRYREDTKYCRDCRKEWAAT